MKIIVSSAEEIASFRKTSEPIMNAILIVQLKNELLKVFQTKIISLLFSDKNDLEILNEIKVRV